MKASELIDHLENHIDLFGDKKIAIQINYSENGQNTRVIGVAFFVDNLNDKGYPHLNNHFVIEADE